ncbi:MAG: L,D-transpeptidase family protein [Candidatus Xenobium sp.]|jgi:hypothetical protein
MSSFASSPPEPPRRFWYWWVFLLALPLLVVLPIVVSETGIHLQSIRLGNQAFPLQPDNQRIWISQASPVLHLKFGLPPLTGVQAQIDGRDLVLEGTWLFRQRTANTGPLADGPHELILHEKNLKRTWGFVVDTHPPALKVLSPIPGAHLGGDRLLLRGQAEAGALVEARAGQAVVQTRSGADGSFSLELPIRHGPNTIRWEARDEAGNRTTGDLEVSCDQTPPKLEVSLRDPPQEEGGERLVRTDSPVLRIHADDRDSGLAEIEVRVDSGKARRVPLPAPGKPAEVRLDGLYDGLRKVEVTALNRAGGRSRDRLEFIVDTTEEFGRATLTLGARGRDVAELQQRLADQGFLRTADVAGNFGEPTLQAVRALQKGLGLQVDGIAGPYTFAALSSRIYVNLAEFSLVLVDWKGEEHYWSIAHGTPDHPTPTGSFVVVDLARDPTWIPPDSPWAREAQVIPPGPGNPLGTRWIGLNHGQLGIHGTPAEWTIGSRASHGCLRMTVPDIEDLFARVNLGTPVRILSGTENDPILGRFWP